MMPRILRAYIVSLVIAGVMVALVHNDVGANLYQPEALNRIMFIVFIPSWVGGFASLLIGGKRKA